jgi:PHD/YefM family antitoxin component YafN of YafNO toxin-antitoxin module
MTQHTYSSRDFTREVGAAKRAATKGPVFITDRGRPAFALLAIDDYHRLAGQRDMSLLQAMQAIDGGSGINFNPPRLHIKRKTLRLG